MKKNRKGRAVIILLTAVLLLLNSLPLFSAEKQNAGQQLEPQTQATTLVGKLNLPGKLGEVVAKTPIGIEKGQINPQVEKGFAGIPGAPQINYVVAFFWAIWVGWIFATVGAFGGIMSGVGHMTLFALGAYASSFKSTNPELNALLTDTIRASNQYLVGLTALILTWNFYRMKRLVVPLGVTLGVGSLFGAMLITYFTADKLKFDQYQGYFGVLVLIIGGVMFAGTTQQSLSKKKITEEMSKKLHQRVKEHGTTERVHNLSSSLSKISFSFYGAEFSFNPLLAILGGAFIAAISAFLGVGGGFLYVSFLTHIIGLPMYIVVGTSALAVLLSMSASLFTHAVLKGTFISWDLVGIEMLGVFVGAMIGPKTQKYIPEKWLRYLFIFLSAYVGIAYFSKGFFGRSWLPMG
ncbi:sulfite exporter TauE/SafE family protein [Candidatus Electronema sp. PJ]|uniref:sulfite exporter TauE/SafE family protein n=1 Tax=Candidatus Electronema sp. PJ TaxID=3401572 RepID=UPI003AA8747E